MNETVSLQQLADRLVRVEREMSSFRGELTELRQQSKAVSRPAPTPLSNAYRWVDREVLSGWVEELFADLCIQGLPMGARLLQQAMERVGLVPNELSQSLVEARKE